MLHIIVNPASSSGHGLQEWKKIEPLFTESGKEYQVHYCSPERPLEQICAGLTAPASKAMASGSCSLVLLGGDGTMNAAVNGIKDFSRTKIGFIQTGSGNDLSRDMHLPPSQKELIASILREEVVHTCDIGKITYHDQYDVINPFTHEIREGLVYSENIHAQEDDTDCANSNLPSDTNDQKDRSRLFNISAGIGFDAACCEMAEMSGWKKILNKVHLGKLVYLFSAIRLILTHPMDRSEITFEESVTGAEEKCSRSVGTTLSYGRTLFAVCMNHKYEGGGFQFCPAAEADDGLLDLCIAADLKRLSFFRIFPTAYGGNHFRFKGITGERAMKVSLRSAIPLWVHTDGEVRCRSTHITVELLPEKLQLLM